ncbi:MAG: hypothetical protein KDD58_06675 [Bdellovibrionales bacterium]|nr:hypothetical protein [Bdellovibrionales bacterium]
MDFLSHMKQLGQILSINSEIASNYNNPSGIGDHRELSLTDIIRDKLPSTLMVSKGEIIDSNGKRTPEFDIVVHYPSKAPNFLNLAGRKVIPCEDVLCVGEIKSQYNEDRLKTCIESVKKLNELRRYYRGTYLLSKLNSLAVEKYKNTPVPIEDGNSGAPAIAAFFFSYKGSSDDTIIGHLEDLKDIPKNFLGTFILNQSQIIKKAAKWTASPANQKDYVLFWLFFSIYGMYSEITKEGLQEMIEVDVDRYITNFVNSHIPN